MVGVKTTSSKPASLIVSPCLEAVFELDTFPFLLFYFNPVLQLGLSPRRRIVERITTKPLGTGFLFFPFSFTVLILTSLYQQSFVSSEFTFTLYQPIHGTHGKLHSCCGEVMIGCFVGCSVFGVSPPISSVPLISIPDEISEVSDGRSWPPLNPSTGSPHRRSWASWILSLKRLVNPEISCSSHRRSTSTQMWA